MNENGGYKGFLSRIPRRRLRFDIVTIFLALLIFSSLIVFLFMYQSNYRGMLKLSSTFVEEATGDLVQRISGITSEMNTVAAISKTLVENQEQISAKNHQLISYMIALIRNQPMVTAVRYLGVDGNSLAVTNVLAISHPAYRRNPNKPLPSSIQFAIRSVDFSILPQVEEYTYLDSNLAVVDTEKITPITTDARTRPFFYDTVAWPRIRWFIGFDPIFGINVLTITIPLYDAKGAVMAVFAANLSLDSLSNYVAFQRIGKTGHAYVLDNNGDILLPDRKLLSTEGEVLIGDAIDERNRLKVNDFSMETNHVKYLVHIVPFPLSPVQRWTVVGIVPFNDYFAPILKSQEQSIWVLLGMLIGVGVLIYFSSSHISKPIVLLADEVTHLRRLDFSKKPLLHSRILEIVWLDTAIQSMRQALQAFGRYVPQGIVKTLIERSDEITLGGERRELTVFFSDIANFTTLCESLTISKLTTSLTEYFEALSKEITGVEGTIDKYIGDSIMAFWGAPNVVVDHAEKACLVALRCLKICNARKDDKIFPWTTRFGIHSGDLVVGNFGTTERMNYTAVGNVVNTAARFQSLNKEYHTSIIISESVHEQLGNRFVCRPLDFISVKGKQNKLTIYELIGTTPEGPDINLLASPEQVTFCQEFTKAYSTFHEGRVREAQELFKALSISNPNDLPTEIYLKRISALLLAS